MKKAVFLDRDGVINEVLTKRVKFVNRPEQFFLLGGVAAAIRQFNEANLAVFVVTNQGGIGLGYMKDAALKRVHQKMGAELKRQNAFIDDIAYCPHRPTAGCACRKPEAQMILDLARKHDVSVSASVMVGDREMDIKAGKKAGCRTVFIGKTNQAGADAFFPSLIEAVPWIMQATST